MRFIYSTPEIGISWEGIQAKFVCILISGSDFNFLAKNIKVNLISAFGIIIDSNCFTQMGLVLENDEQD